MQQTNSIQRCLIDKKNSILINNPNLKINDFKMNHLMFKNNPLLLGEAK